MALSGFVRRTLSHRSPVSFWAISCFDAWIDGQRTWSLRLGGPLGTTRFHPNDWKRGGAQRAGGSGWKPKKGTVHAVTDSGFRDLEVRRFARGEASSSRSCTNLRFKDGRDAFPQEWHRRGRQGWCADRQRECTRLGVWRTGRPPGPAPYGRCEDSGAI